MLHLAPGRWQLSLPYVSPEAVTVSTRGLAVRLPANLDRPGSVWPVGTVSSTGAPITLLVAMTNPGAMSSLLPVTQYFVPESMVATALIPERTIPLKAACGRYVDWYRLG